MKTPILPRWIVAAFAVLLLAATQGCETTGSWRAEQAAQEREDILLLREDMQRLSGRIEGVELDIQRVDNSLNSLQGTRQSELRTLQSRMDELDGRITRVDAAREKDKQELIEKLSAKIAELMSKMAKPTPSRSTKTSARKYSDTGYEHVVAAGETLSTIAQAYGVTVQAIIDNNHIKDPNKVRVGEKLFVPE